MEKSYVYRAYPSAKQRELIKKTFGCERSENPATLVVGGSRGILLYFFLLTVKIQN